MSNIFVNASARLLVRLARYPLVQDGVRKLASTYRQQQVLSETSANQQIPEVLPIDARPSEARGGRRLNLLVPAVSERHVFGGIETALKVFDALRPYFDQARIIVTDESTPEPKADAYYGAWPIASLSGEAPLEDHIVAAGSRWAQTLAVHSQDHFMATAWWTAHNAFSLLSWQQAHYPEGGYRRMLYLIQDYEPGFYAWSSRYLLAQATYAQPERTIALINSQWLADYLLAQGHEYSISKVLAPQLHPALFAARARRETFFKERILLVYGRPGTERNAFSLVLAALRIWARQYPQASQWRVLSAGETFDPIDLGGGCQLLSVGKLDINAYADLLCRTAVGFSLMVSPHPSYPPLEMAAFGARVVTNRFANKDLSRVSPALVSAEPPNPDGFATALLSMTGEFDTGYPGTSAVHVPDIVWHDGFLQAPGGNEGWAAEIVAGLRGDSPAASRHFENASL